LHYSQVKSGLRRLQKGIDTKNDTESATTNDTVDDTNDIPRKRRAAYNTGRNQLNRLSVNIIPNVGEIVSHSEKSAL